MSAPCRSPEHLEADNNVYEPPCQRPSVSPQRRPCDLPTGGRGFRDRREAGLARRPPMPPVAAIAMTSVLTFGP